MCSSCQYMWYCIASESVLNYFDGSIDIVWKSWQGQVCIPRKCAMICFKEMGALPDGSTTLKAMPFVQSLILSITLKGCFHCSIYWIRKTENLSKDALDQNWKLKLCKIQNYAKCITMYICTLHNFVIRKILHNVILYTAQLCSRLGRLVRSGRSVRSIGRGRSVWLPFNWIEYNCSTWEMADL